VNYKNCENYRKRVCFSSENYFSEKPAHIRNFQTVYYKYAYANYF
jgi:hypothetical protein